MSQDAVVTYFTVSSLQFPGVTEENHGNPRGE
jgi:hypothetical protein